MKTVPIQNEQDIKCIPEAWAAEAYEEYRARFGSSQSFERLHERGGFGVTELIWLLAQRCKRLQGMALDTWPPGYNKGAPPTIMTP